ncbi:MAG: ATP-binding protein [Acidobacteria bacterium]|nr:ATP-binding protein [Acidobacteriota bacterium]
MKRAHLRFSSEILRRLGEELNPSLEKGVLELVKNAYDADARHCVVELLEAERPGGAVVVTDDGDGMSVDEIVNGWLVLGRSKKIEAATTPLGRTPAGSKGLGRLAALRMGSKALLKTRERIGEGEEHRLLIDWARFDAADVVEDVVLHIETSQRDPEVRNGTEVRVDNLKSGFGRMSVKRLARELILLADPFGDDPSGFRPDLKAEEYRDLEALVQARYFQDAEYHLEAAVDSNGLARASVKDWKGHTLFAACHEDLVRARGKRKYECPPVLFNLWVFILNQQTFSTRRSSVSEVREWLREFGGVHFYYNGLRVSPYGNPGNDWLEMNLRRVRSPEERPSTNTSIGRVEVGDAGDLLVQKTDRSGFIEDEVFLDIRAFGQDALDWMARRRLVEAEKRRDEERVEAPKRSGAAAAQVEQAIGRAPGDVRPNIEKAFQRYEKSRDREVRALQKEVQLYRTLSTAGITAVTFAHESSGSSIKVISHSVEAIARRAKQLVGDSYDKFLRGPVESIRTAVESVSVLGAATLRLVNHEKRRYARVDLHSVIEDSVALYGPFVRGRDVDLDVSLFDGAPYLRGSEAAIEAIVANLLTNSLAAFEDAGTRKRVLRIETSITSNRWILRVEDSGPGIVGIGLDEIWLPGRSTRRNGTGLGLTIVRDAARDLGGSVSAVAHGELGGAVLGVELPILGS